MRAQKHTENYLPQPTLDAKAEKWRFWSRFKMNFKKKMQAPNLSRPSLATRLAADFVVFPLRFTIPPLQNTRYWAHTDTVQRQSHRMRLTIVELQNPLKHLFHCVLQVRNTKEERQHRDKEQPLNHSKSFSRLEGRLENILSISEHAPQPPLRKARTSGFVDAFSMEIPGIWRTSFSHKTHLRLPSKSEPAHLLWSISSKPSCNTTLAQTP